LKKAWLEQAKATEIAKIQAHAEVQKEREHLRQERKMKKEHMDHEFRMAQLMRGTSGPYNQPTAASHWPVLGSVSSRATSSSFDFEPSSAASASYSQDEGSPFNPSLLLHLDYLGEDVLPHGQAK
jgi:hypothetical protein